MKTRILSFIIISSFVLWSGCGSDTTTPVTPTTGTVNGKVVDAYGNPIPGVTTVIGSSSAVTASDGSFTINSVTTPYNVKLVLLIGGSPTGIMYQGITTLSPQLYGLGFTASPSNATLSVTVPALAANQSATVIFTDNALVHSSQTISSPNITAQVNVTWQNSAPITGKIIVLVYTTNGTGTITSYDKYGEKSGFVVNNGINTATTFTAADLNVTPSSATVSGSVTAPAGYSTPATKLYLKFTAQGSNSVATHIGATVSGTNFSFLVPTGLTSAFTTGLQSNANTAGGEMSIKILTGTIGSSNTITMETPPQLSAPVNAATNIDTTTNFTFSSGTGTGIYLVMFTTTAPPLKRFIVMTASTSTTIPSFSAYGLSLGASTAYGWQVYKFGSMSTVNDFVLTAFGNNSNFNLETLSLGRTFTTTP